jgi:hypothetical protein
MALSLDRPYSLIEIMLHRAVEWAIPSRFRSADSC